MSLSNGKTFTYSVVSYTKGKNALLKAGYELCANKNYLKKDKVLCHYNTIMMVWKINDSFDGNKNV